MNKTVKAVAVLIGLLCCCSVTATGSEEENLQASAHGTESTPAMHAFTKNIGQWPDSILFRADAGGATMWITREGVYYQFSRRTVRNKNRTQGDSFGPDGIPAWRDNESDSIDILLVKAQFVGAYPDAEIVGYDEVDYRCNYFLGNDPAKWRSDVPNYGAVVMRQIYPGVDVHFRSSPQGELVYRYEAADGAEISLVQLAYEGVEDVATDGNERTVADTRFGKIIGLLAAPACNAQPFAYVALNTGQLVDMASLSDAGCSSESVALIYSTYLGGGDLDYGRAVALDESGCAYVTGHTESADFPIISAYAPSITGNYDVFVTKLSVDGGSLVYSTFIGGSTAEEGHDIAVDPSGSAYLTGLTLSFDFPTVNPFSASRTGYCDAFVSKLSPSGNSLIYSTYLGGNGTQEGRGIAVDDSGCAFVTGFTQSTDFPAVNAYDASYNGGSHDVFVTKLADSGSSLVYSTYLGGSGVDAYPRIAVDGSGYAYVTGQTSSTDFPRVNAYDDSYNGGDRDAFVTKLSSVGNSLVYSTYIGGSSNDYCYGIVVGGTGYAYVTGGTQSIDFPTVNAWDDSYNGGDRDAFVTRLSADGGSLIYSTYLGGSTYDAFNSIAVDGSNCAFVTGQTQSSDFPTANAYDDSHNGSYDVIVAKLAATGTALMYSTYLGGSGWDAGNRVVPDGSGCAWVTGYTLSSGFPTVNAYDDSYNGGQDAFVAKLSFAYVDFVAAPRCGGAPLTVQFTDLSTASSPTAWLWDFGDGQTSPLRNPSHVYTTEGYFDVTLTVWAGSEIGSRSRHGYVVTEPNISAQFSANPARGSLPLTVAFTPFLSAESAVYQWDFGDGGTSGAAYPVHTYQAAGYYGVQLQLSLEIGDCYYENTVTEEDCIAACDLKAGLTASPRTGVAPLIVQFSDLSVGSPDSWLWEFGDGYTSTSQNPSHVYDTAGRYDVKLSVSRNLTGVMCSDATIEYGLIYVAEPYVDISVGLGGTCYIRNDFAGFLYVCISNDGNVLAEDCEVSVCLPTIVTFLDAWGPLTHGGVDTVGDFVRMYPGDVEAGIVSGFIEWEMSHFAPQGAVMEFEASVSTSTPEDRYDNNQALHRALVVTSIDPNDKTASPAGTGPLQVIEPDQRLSYLIQFENNKEATAEAYYIFVVDTLDPNLDWGTLDIGGMSHPDDCVWHFDPFTGVITWFCDSIMLPPNITPPEGEGFVTYSIAPDSGLAPGTEITNTAWIRFDYNPWIQAPETGPVTRVIRFPSCCGLYTGGMTGNTNCDVDGKRNLADISKLIDRVYITKVALCCEENGNVNGDVEGRINLADISKLIDHVYISKTETAPCP